jgi:hypothetical protein
MDRGAPPAHCEVRRRLNFIVRQPLHFALLRMSRTGFPSFLRHNIDQGPLVSDKRVRGNTFHQENICADRGPGSNNGFAPEDRGVRVDCYPILYIGMSFPALLDLAFLILLKAAGAQCNAVVKLHV